MQCLARHNPRRSCTEFHILTKFYFTPAYDGSILKQLMVLKLSIDFEKLANIFQFEILV